MLSPSNNRRLPGTFAAALLLSISVPAIAASEATVTGLFALPGVAEQVSGELHVTETGPLTRKLQVRFTNKATGKPIEKFEVELTQELHLLTTDDALSTLIHRHVEHASPEGVFQAELSFPKAGLYHIYADAVPSGFGQQVVRFDLEVGKDIAPVAPTDRATPAQSTETTHGLLESSDGEYTVLLDPSSLRAGQSSMVKLTVEKDGEPAADIQPYLGVAAHAVFIGTEDLAYVHAHAMQKNEAGDMHGMDHGGSSSESAPEPSHEHGSEHKSMAPTAEHSKLGVTAQPEADHNNNASQVNAGHAGHGEQAMSEGSHYNNTNQVDPDHEAHRVLATPHRENNPPAMPQAHEHGSPTPTTDEHEGSASQGEPLSPEMMLYVTPPAPGRYALWIEFMGGGEVQTVPFTVEVPGETP